MDNPESVVLVGSVTDEEPVFCEKHGLESPPCWDWFYRESTGGEE